MNLYGFWAAIDISENIQRGLTAIKGIKGLNALILLLALGAINYGLFWLVLFFDVGATLEWTEQAAIIIAPTVPPEFGQYTSYLVLSITLLPTMIELFTSRFAAAGMTIAAGLVFAFSLFDAVTDWPRVVLFMDAYKSAFDALGFLAWPAFQITRLLWLFMATFGFEALFVVFTVCMIALAFQAQSRATGKKGHAA